MPETLNEIERRVFGVLLEKALAQPQYYPMTTNAIVAACNQKSNRDPLMNLDEDAIWNTLEVLRAAQLVSRLLPGGASRVERFKHEAKEVFGWEKPQRAVMAELLLRGPQTVSELRARCQRMYPFDSNESVTAVLNMLSEANPPRVATLPRAPGQSAVRYAHRLYAAEEWDALAALKAWNPASPHNHRSPSPTRRGGLNSQSSIFPRSLFPALWYAVTLLLFYPPRLKEWSCRSLRRASPSPRSTISHRPTTAHPARRSWPSAAST